MKNIDKSKQRGFSLSEVMISLAILSLFVAVALPLFPQIMTWVDQSEERFVSDRLLSRVVSDIEDTAQELPFERVTTSETAFRQSDVAVLPTYEYRVDLYATHESVLDIYKVNIQIVSNTGNLLSESYMYIKGSDTR